MAKSLAAGKLLVPVYPGGMGTRYIGDQLRLLQGMEDVEALQGKNAYPLHEDSYAQSVKVISTAIRRHQQLPQPARRVAVHLA